MNDVGAKRLIAAILKQAYEDFKEPRVTKKLENGGNITVKQCPPWCPIINTCTERALDKNFCSAKTFLKSAWSATLCDAVDIDHKDFVTRTISQSRVARETYRYIESELRWYNRTRDEIERIKKDIIFATGEQNEIKGTYTGDQTYNKVAKIVLDRRIARYEQTIKAIQKVYDACDEKRKKMIRLKYWQNQLTDYGIANELGVNQRTIIRWKREIIYAIALELGYI